MGLTGPQSQPETSLVVPGASLKSFTEMAGIGETSISFWFFGVPGIYLEPN